MLLVYSSWQRWVYSVESGIVEFGNPESRNHVTMEFEGVELQNCVIIGSYRLRNTMLDTIFNTTAFQVIWQNREN